MKETKRKMKVVWVQTVSILFLASCSSDDAVKTIPSDSLIGTWETSNFIANEPLFDVNNDGINSTELLDELPCRYSIFKLNEDKTFYQENNSWQFNQSSNSYSCTSGDDISKVTGKWSVNSNKTMLILEIGEHTAFLEIEFDGEILAFNSSEILINKDALGENKNIYGRAFYKRN